VNKIPNRVEAGHPVPASPKYQGAIELIGISKRFNKVVALTNISLRIEAGEFFSLLGPSGCGKTTLLRILAGLESPDEGKILLDGRDITRLPPERRPFNIVFQRYALFPHLSVYDNVAFGLTTDRRNRASEDELRERVYQILDLVGLSGFGGRMPGQLSGGQAQRVAVARALVRRPELLLLDEPLSALDRNVRHAMREELLRIHNDLGTTFLLVTHDQEEALSMSQRVALLNSGHVEQVSEPEVMYRNPATLFAARFVGAGTLAKGVVCRRVEGRVEVEVGARKALAVDAGVGSSQLVQVLFRPEDLQVIPLGSADGLPGTVQTCVFFGSYYETTIRCESDGVFRVRSPHALAPETRLQVVWPVKAGIAYPVATESAGDH
jgi:spermidine/putrescine transport system ATP-binding protein